MPMEYEFGITPAAFPSVALTDTPVLEMPFTSLASR
jgi:hypothetical protein